MRSTLGRLLFFALLFVFFVSCKAKAAEDAKPAAPAVGPQAEAAQSLQSLIPALNFQEKKPAACETYCKFDPHAKNPVH